MVEPVQESKEPLPAAEAKEHIANGSAPQKLSQVQSLWDIEGDLVLDDLDEEEDAEQEGDDRKKEADPGVPMSECPWEGYGCLEKHGVLTPWTQTAEFRQRARGRHRARSRSAGTQSKHLCTDAGVNQTSFCSFLLSKCLASNDFVFAQSSGTNATMVDLRVSANFSIFVTSVHGKWPASVPFATVFEAFRLDIGTSDPMAAVLGSSSVIAHREIRQCFEVAFWRLENGRMRAQECLVIVLNRDPAPQHGLVSPHGAKAAA